MGGVENSNVLEFPATACLLIPEGRYHVAFERYGISTRFGRGSLELWFAVKNYGPYFGHRLARFYKVSRDGKRSFRASPHSAFAREFAAVFGRIPPVGLSAVSFFRDVYVEASVRTVQVDHRQRQIPVGARYSVIDELIGRGPA